MAARKNRGTLDKPWEDNVRQKIQASMIVNRLTALVKGEVEMAPHAVTAALGLLRKALPDLTSVEHSGEVATTKVIRTPNPTADLDAWRQQFADKPKETLQ